LHELMKIRIVCSISNLNIKAVKGVKTETIFKVTDNQN